MKSTIVVTAVPNACDFVGELNGEKIIYYCVDDFSEWPGHDRGKILAMEHKLIDQSDIFIATSQKLFNRLNNWGKPVFLLPHGVDVRHFMNSKTEEHSCLKGIPRPRVGYLGLFDERIDRDLLYDVASGMPDVSFVITGPREVADERLMSLKNVFFTGKIPYEESPQILAGWDICMIPYRLNKLTKAINPLKLKEYLASGKPVLTTPLPEAQKLSEFITLAESSRKWKEAIRKLLKFPTSPNDNALKDFLQREDWANKARQFLEICGINYSRLSGS